MNLLKSKASCLSLLLLVSISYPVHAEKTETPPECEEQSSQMNNRIGIVENPMNGATLAWKKPNIVISKTEDQLGLIESGAKVKILCELSTTGLLKFVTQVEILEGRLKGEVGWVSSSMIKIR